MRTILPVVPVPRAERLRRLRLQAVPLLVWLLAAGAAAVMLLGRAGSAHYPGVGHGLDCQIAAVAAARVEAVLVSLNEPVTASQPVVLLDDTLLNASINTASVNLRKLRADLAASAASLAVDTDRVVADLLRLQMEEDGRRLDALSLQATLSADTIEIERLGLELQRTRKLARGGLLPQAASDNARLSHDQLQARTRQTQALLAQTEEEWKAARARREAYERRLPSVGAQQKLLVPFQEAIAVAEAEVREIELQRAALVLRSPIAGQVSQIWCTAGQAVTASTPILTIAESAVRDILVYADETSARRIAPGQRVTVTRVAPPVLAASSEVVTVGETVQQLPTRFWRDPRMPRYGRTVVVAPARGLSLGVGELVDVSVSR